MDGNLLSEKNKVEIVSPLDLRSQVSRRGLIVHMIFRSQLSSLSAQQPFRVRQPKPYKKCFRRGQFGHWASFIICPDLGRSLANRVASLTPLKYRQQVTKPFKDLDQMSILVSFMIPTLFLVVTNGDVLDRSYADFLEGSYSVIVKGLSILMSGSLYDFFLLRPKNSGLQIGATNDVRPELGIDRTNPCRISCPAFTDSFREILVSNYLIITRATFMFAIEKNQYNNRQFSGREIPDGRKFPRCHRVLLRTQVIVSSIITNTSVPDDKRVLPLARCHD